MKGRLVLVALFGFLFVLGMVVAKVETEDDGELAQVLDEDEYSMDSELKDPGQGPPPPPGCSQVNCQKCKRCCKRLCPRCPPIPKRSSDAILMEDIIDGLVMDLEELDADPQPRRPCNIRCIPPRVCRCSKIRCRCVLPYQEDVDHY